jgi:hypothetical protein
VADPLRWANFPDITLSRCARFLIWKVGRGEWMLYTRAQTGPHPFSEGGVYDSKDDAKAQAEKLAKEAT